MKAVLEFDIDDPDDRQAHLRCTKSLNMACAIFEIAYNLPKNLERQLDANKDLDIITRLREEIIQIWDDHDILVDELVS